MSVNTEMQENLHSPEDVGARIRAMRKKHRYTQSQMAEMLGMSLSNYSKIEVGARNASQSVLVWVAKTLNCTVGWLLTGDGDPPQRPPPPAVREAPVVYPTIEERMTIGTPKTVEAAIAVLAEQFHLDVKVVRECLLECLIKKRNGEA